MPVFTKHYQNLRVSPFVFYPIHVSDTHKCQSCSYYTPLTRCFHCHKFICANCITEGGLCVWCLNDDNSILALEYFIKMKYTKTRWFKVSTETGLIVPVTKKKWWFSFY